MGLAASQVRMLSLTSRKASIERDMLRDSNRKVALSREMNSLANEYYDALSKERLMYLSNSGEYKNLTYTYLMGKPGGIEDIDVKSDRALLLFERETGNVVLSKEMADRIGFTPQQLASSSDNIYLAIAKLCGDRNITIPDGCTDDLIISPNLVKDICAGKFDSFTVEDLTNAINNENYYIYSPEISTITTYTPVVNVVNAIEAMNSVTLMENGLNRVNQWIHDGTHFTQPSNPSLPDLSVQVPNYGLYDLNNQSMNSGNIYTIFANGIGDNYIIDTYFANTADFTFGTYSQATVPTDGTEEAVAAAETAKVNETNNIKNRIKNFARGMATNYFGAESYNDLSLQQKMAVAAVLSTFDISEIRSGDLDTPLEEDLYNRESYAYIVDTDAPLGSPTPYEIKFDTTLFLNALELAYENTQTGGEFELENYSGDHQTVQQHYRNMYNNQSGTAYQFGNMATVKFRINQAPTMHITPEYQDYDGFGMLNNNSFIWTDFKEVLLDPNQSTEWNQGLDDFDFYTSTTTPLYSTIDNLYYLSDTTGGNHLVQVNSASVNGLNNQQELREAITNVLSPIASALTRSMPQTLIGITHAHDPSNPSFVFEPTPNSPTTNFDKIINALNATRAEFIEGSTGGQVYTLNNETNRTSARVISSSDITNENTDLTNIRLYLTSQSTTNNGYIHGYLHMSNVNSVLNSANYDTDGYTNAPALGYATSDGDDYHSAYDIEELKIIGDAEILNAMAGNAPGIDQPTQSDAERQAVYTIYNSDEGIFYYYVDASALINDFYAQVLGENIGYGYDTDGKYEYLAPEILTSTINTPGGFNPETGEWEPGGTLSYATHSDTSTAGYTPYVDGNDLAKILRIQTGDKQKIYATKTVANETTDHSGHIYMYNDQPLQFCPAGDSTTQWINNFQDLINDVKFYYTIVTACAKYGYNQEYDANLSDSDYLDKNIQNGIFQLMGFETDVFSLDSYKDTDYYLLTSEFSKMNDPAQQAIITAWYESEKAEINAKETVLDTDIENLSTELNSITTEIESVKKLINDAVKNTFDWGKS